MLNKSSIKKEILTSYPFIIALAILALNDFVLKQAFGNWITGKLSDFAGLFVFPLLLSALLPRYFKLMHWITALGFVFWKSEYSESFIILCNSNLGLNWQRVVDYTDLIALISVVFSYFYFQKEKFYTVKISYKPILVMAVFFSFASYDGPRFLLAEMKNKQYLAYKCDSNAFSELIKNNYILNKNKNYFLSLYYSNFNYKSKIFVKNDTIIIELDTFFIRPPYLYDTYNKYNLAQNANSFFFHEFNDLLSPKYKIEKIDTAHFEIRLNRDSIVLNIKNSQMHGSFELFDLESHILRNGYMINGIEEGEFKTFINNKLTKIDYYKNGFLFQNKDLSKERHLVTKFESPIEARFRIAIRQLVILEAILLLLAIFLVFSLLYEKKIAEKKLSIWIKLIISILTPLIAIILGLFYTIKFDEFYKDIKFLENLIYGFVTSLLIPSHLIILITWLAKIKKFISLLLIILIVFIQVQINDLIEYLIFFISSLK